MSGCVLYVEFWVDKLAEIEHVMHPCLCRLCLVLDWWLELTVKCLFMSPLFFFFEMEAIERVPRLRWVT